MKSKIIIVISCMVLLLVVLLVAAGWQGPDNAASRNLDRQSFGYKDTSPGGCYAAYKLLPHLYVYRGLKVVTKPFSRTFRKDKDLRTGTSNLYVLVAPVMHTSGQDVADMLSFVEAGNQLFLATYRPDSLLMQRLGCELDSPFGGKGDYGSVQCYVNPHLAPDTMFSRERIAGGRYFTRLDTGATTILGTDAARQPNFVRVSIGNGSVFLLLNPSSWTNYFLMHERNTVSLSRQLAYTNSYAGNVYWDEYYKYRNSPESPDFSEWQVLMRYPSMRWAFWLAVALLLLYVFFQGKRRQRIIPEKPVLANNSLEFVDALGQLYYRQHNNRNLARKIIMQWLEYIRSRFYLNTSHLNEAFTEKLARKAGRPAEEIKEIVDSIHHIQLAENISDAYLQTFYSNIQQFYINTR